MTLAGTRPPTVDEWDKYELHHRARLATKPGLTGMWQVSGRSNITDLQHGGEKLFEYYVMNDKYVAVQMPDGKYIPKGICCVFRYNNLPAKNVLPSYVCDYKKRVGLFQRSVDLV